MTTAEVLRKALALIDTPEKWTKVVIARNAHGKEVSHRSADAVCFCMDGALARAADLEISRGRYEYEGATRAIRTATGEREYWLWNDAPERTHAEVVAAFQKAIAAAEAGE